MHAFDMPRRAYGVALESGATIVVIAGILVLDHNRLAMACRNKCVQAERVARRNNQHV